MDLINNFLSKKKNKIILFVLLDIIVLTLVSLLAIYLRFDLKDVPQNYLVNAYKYLPVDILIMLFVFTLFRLYTSVWSYASVVELLNVGTACTFYEVIKFGYRSFFEILMPRSYYLIELLLLIFFVSMIRFSYRILRVIVIKIENKKSGINTLIVGAGQATRMLIDEIENNKKNFNNKVLCLIDDDRNKKGVYIKGIPVVGNRKDIEFVCNKYDIEEIIIAIPSASKKKIALIKIMLMN